MPDRIVIAGASGVIGSAAVVHFAKAGFAPCRDSLDSMLHWLRKMADAGLLPRMIGEG